jgi:two-component sensor histidine kinase
MAAVHAMLSHSSWVAVPLEEMIGKLMPHGRRGTVKISGSPVHVPAQQCTPMAMVIGELMANSLKYGALSAAGGLVMISWHVRTEQPESTVIDLNWVETGGPPIESEPQARLGTSLIRGFVRSDLRGEAALTYPRAGAAHRFTITLDYSHHHAEAGKE